MAANAVGFSFRRYRLPEEEAGPEVDDGPEPAPLSVERRDL